MIPQDQLCQAFDPMMILPEKNIFDGKKSMSTSCVAPAFVYLEGSRGKRFLCDFHYYYEKNITTFSNPEEWSDISKIFFEKLESIAETFDKTKTERTFFEKCWCTKDAFVSIKSNESLDYFCNFHYRKQFYRSLSNKENPLIWKIINDERILNTKTIKEEMEELTQI